MGSTLSSLGLGSSGNNNGMSGYGSALTCCDGVVDPLILLSVLGAITALTVWLRQQIIDKVMMDRRRRRKKRHSGHNSFLDKYIGPQNETKESLNNHLIHFVDSFMLLHGGNEEFSDLLINGRKHTKI